MSFRIRFLYSSLLFRWPLLILSLATLLSPPRVRNFCWRSFCTFRFIWSSRPYLMHSGTFWDYGPISVFQAIDTTWHVHYFAHSVAYPWSSFGWWGGAELKNTKKSLTGGRVWFASSLHRLQLGICASTSYKWFYYFQLPCWLFSWQTTLHFIAYANFSIFQFFLLTIEQMFTSTPIYWVQLRKSFLKFWATFLNQVLSLTYF